MEIELRLEEEKDYKTVENLTREAFWNHYVPGCDEHLLVHNLRKTNVFIKELDFVAIYNNKIVGNFRCFSIKSISSPCFSFYIWNFFFE